MSTPLSLSKLIRLKEVFNKLAVGISIVLVATYIAIYILELSSTCTVPLWLVVSLTGAAVLPYLWALAYLVTKLIIKIYTKNKEIG